MGVSKRRLLIKLYYIICVFFHFGSPPFFIVLFWDLPFPIMFRHLRQVVLPAQFSILNKCSKLFCRAARFVKGNFQWTASVTEMLRSLNWETLRSRREKLSLGLFKRFNLACNSNFIANIFRANQRVQRRHAHSKPLIEIRAKQDWYYWSFFLRSIRQWNNLPINCTDLSEIQFNNDV